MRMWRSRLSTTPQRRGGDRSGRKSIEAIPAFDGGAGCIIPSAQKHIGNFFHFFETDFMNWVLSHCGRCADIYQEKTTTDDSNAI